jgi:hypothetical protein
MSARWHRERNDRQAYMHMHTKFLETWVRMGDISIRWLCNVYFRSLWWPRIPETQTLILNVLDWSSLPLSLTRQQPYHWYSTAPFSKTTLIGPSFGSSDWSQTYRTLIGQQLQPPLWLVQSLQRFSLAHPRPLQFVQCPVYNDGSDWSSINNGWSDWSNLTVAHTLSKICWLEDRDHTESINTGRRKCIFFTRNSFFS